LKKLYNNMLMIYLAVNWDGVFEGLLIAAVGYLVVLIALGVLYYVFRYLPLVLQLRIRYRLRRQGKPVEHGEELGVNADISAAIALALHLYLNEIHDEETTAVTIRKVSRNYSPWSSKIFGTSNRLRR
jgi:glutaconyl-CoA/methylmalonyl-CoA decarboxylase subunit delta